jgi:cytochrome P450
VASDSIEQYLKDLLEARRADLGDDLVSTMIRAADEDGRFTNDEIVSTMILLINAGHKTTAFTISNGMEALFANPDQLALLRKDPSLAPGAIEEFLRYQPPVYRGTLRLATENMELAGVHIGKESFVHVMISSANRDPKVFEDPDRLDITRTGNRHFSFGHGAHFCPGSRFPGWRPRSRSTPCCAGSRTSGSRCRSTSSSGSTTTRSAAASPACRSPTPRSCPASSRPNSLWSAI